MAKSGPGPAKTTVLVEVGSEWLKIIQAEPRRGGVGISKIHLEKVSGTSRAIADQVKTALRKGRFAKAPVIACLPRQMMTVRMLELPSTDHEEIGDMVDLQIGKQTPYSRDEIAFDYRVAGSGRNGYTRVMLAIVQRSTIRDRYYILEEAGVNVERMTVSGRLLQFRIRGAARPASRTWARAGWPCRLRVWQTRRSRRTGTPRSETMTSHWSMRRSRGAKYQL